jgi:hypothetical protein
MGDGAEGRVVVKAAPTSTLEVIEAQLLLQLLVIALDAPAKLGEAHEGTERGVWRERRQPILRRRFFSVEPLAQQPLLDAWLAAVLMSMSRANPDGSESG